MRGTYGLQTRVTNDEARKEWDGAARLVRKQLALIQTLIDEADKAIDKAVIPSAKRSQLRSDVCYDVLCAGSWLDNAVDDAKLALANAKTGIASAKADAASAK